MQLNVRRPMCVSDSKMEARTHFMAPVEIHHRHLTTRRSSRRWHASITRIGSLVFFITLATFIQACTDAGSAPPTSALSFPEDTTSHGAVSFVRDVQPIFLNNCALAGCHNASSHTGNFNTSTYATLRSGGYTFGAAVIVAGDSSGSALMQLIRSNNNLIGLRMPLGGPYKDSGLPDSLIVRIGRWIVEGAPNN